jgi:hypothetical protein
MNREGKRVGVLWGGMLGAMLVSSVAVSVAEADTAPRSGMDGERRTALFRELKGMESESHRERIRILQEAEACIQRATAFPEYRQCERTEQEARERLRERLKPKREALREQVRSARRPDAAPQGDGGGQYRR